MAWDTGDVIEVILKQTALEQLCLNVLTFRIGVKDINADETEILPQLGQHIIDAMILAQGPDAAHYEQDYNNITTELEFFRTSIIEVGEAGTGEPSASFDAFGLTKVCESRITRPGGMRVCGVTESHTEGNDLTSGMIAILLTMGVSISEPLGFVDQSARGMDFKLYVIGRLPEGGYDLTKQNNVVAMTNPRLTSQVSRRRKA